MQEVGGIYGNVTVRNVRIDTSVGRVIGVILEDENGSIVEGLFLRDFTIREPMEWFCGGESKEEGENFMVVNVTGGFIRNVQFDDIWMAGKKIEKNEDLDLRTFGNISQVVYSPN